MADNNKDTPGCPGCGSSDDGQRECGALANGPIHSVDPETGLFIEAEAVDGLLHGVYSEYYDIDDENLKLQGQYDRGVKQGVWSEFDREGIAVKVEIYDKGVLLEKRVKK